MQTLWELEYAGVEWDGSELNRHKPPSGRLSVDFSQCGSTVVSGSSMFTTAPAQNSQEHSQAKLESSVQATETQPVKGIPNAVLRW